MSFVKKLSADLVRSLIAVAAFNVLEKKYYEYKTNARPVTFP